MRDGVGLGAAVGLGEVGGVVCAVDIISGLERRLAMLCCNGRMYVGSLPCPSRRGSGSCLRYGVKWRRGGRRCDSLDVFGRYARSNAGARVDGWVWAGVVGIVWIGDGCSGGDRSWLLALGRPLTDA